MKKTLVAAMSAAVVASAFYAFAQTNSVYSGNAVGFIRVEIAKGGWGLITVPLKPMTNTTVTLPELLSTNLPDGTAVYFWNTGSQQWDKEEYGYNIFTGKYEWQPGTTQFPVGAGLFVNVPASAPSNTYTVYLTGEVPASATTAVYQVEGFTLFGYPYPVSSTLTGTVFGANATDGDIVFYWSNDHWEKEEYGYNIFTGKYEWQPGTLAIEPGAAVFYKAVQGQTNQVARPYSYPAN